MHSVFAKIAICAFHLLQIKPRSCGLKTNSRNMSLLQRNNESRRIPGMKECKMTQENIKENGKLH